ncbi:MAG: hypothetical protein AAFX99_34480, partial [Myxococcota bacterium]
MSVYGDEGAPLLAGSQVLLGQRLSFEPSADLAFAQLYEVQLAQMSVPTFDEGGIHGAEVTFDVPWLVRVAEGFASTPALIAVEPGVGVAGVEQATYCLLGQGLGDVDQVEIEGGDSASSQTFRRSDLSYNPDTETLCFTPMALTPGMYDVTVSVEESGDSITIVREADVLEGGLYVVDALTVTDIATDHVSDDTYVSVLGGTPLSIVGTGLGLGVRVYMMRTTSDASQRAGYELTATSLESDGSISATSLPCVAGETYRLVVEQIWTHQLWDPEAQDPEPVELRLTCVDDVAPVLTTRQRPATRVPWVVESSEPLACDPGRPSLEVQETPLGVSGTVENVSSNFEVDCSVPGTLTIQALPGFAWRPNRELTYTLSNVEDLASNVGAGLTVTARTADEQAPVVQGLQAQRIPGGAWQPLDGQPEHAWVSGQLYHVRVLATDNTTADGQLSVEVSLDRDGAGVFAPLQLYTNQNERYVHVQLVPSDTSLAFRVKVTDEVGLSTTEVFTTTITAPNLVLSSSPVQVQERERTALDFLLCGSASDVALLQDVHVQIDGRVYPGELSESSGCSGSDVG